MNREDLHIHRLLDLCEQLIKVSVDGSEAAKDDGCFLLFGIVQDYAYKMRKAGKDELALHKRRLPSPDEDNPTEK